MSHIPNSIFNTLITFLKQLNIPCSMYIYGIDMQFGVILPIKMAEILYTIAKPR